MADNRTMFEKLKDEFIPSIASGAIGVVAASFLLGVDLSIQLPVGNMNVPAWVAIGGSIAASDLIAYGAHDWVLEKIPSIQGFATLENRLLAPVLSGAASYLLFRTAVSPDTSLINSMLLGAGSSVGGQYLAETLKQYNPAL